MYIHDYYNSLSKTLKRLMPPLLPRAVLRDTIVVQRKSFLINHYG
jgi:hypothetical protein